MADDLVIYIETEIVYIGDEGACVRVTIEGDEDSFVLVEPEDLAGD